MAIEVFPVSNTFTGTDVDEFANSTTATESFTMGGGSNVINFDLSNNQLLGADEIHLTTGENLVINFTSPNNYNYFNTSLIKWERVVNNNNGIDLVIETSPFCTYGYYKVEVICSDEIDYQSSYYTYYKAVVKEYLYDYDNDEWTQINSYNSTARYDTTSYRLCSLKSNGKVYSSYLADDGGSDKHEERRSLIGTATSDIDYEAVLNKITIKDIGTENAANSLKIQYTNPNNGSVQVYKETQNGTYQDVDFIHYNYALGSKYTLTSDNQTLQGSFLDETFWAGYGDDTINAVGGTNTINLYNGGKDIITLGAGNDYIDATFQQGQAQGHYEDLNTNTIAEGVLIKNGTNVDTLKINSDYGNGLNFYRTKDTNNLVIIQNYQYNAGNGLRSRLSKITIEDYFTAESKINIKSGYIYNSYNYEHFYTLNGENTITDTYMYYGNSTPEERTTDYTIGTTIEGETTITGTDNSEVIIATAQSGITTGAGNDTIYTTSANDVITVDGSGDKTIVIDENSGDDTIVISNHEANVYLDMRNANGVNLYKSKDADNNDLVIKRFRHEYENGGYVVKFEGNTIIKDYFLLSAEEKAKINVRTFTTWGSDYYKQLAVGELNINGDTGKTNIITGSDYDDVITGKELIDTIYTGKGEDKITPNAGDDVININDTGSKYIYLTKEDGNDTINLSGDALQNYIGKYSSTYYSYLYLYSDSYTGGSYQIDNGNLVLYRTYVDGDNIETKNTTITGITGTGDLTVENIVSGSSTRPLNISNRLIYRNGDNSSSYYFAANTPWFLELNPTENNTYNTENDDYVSHLIIGGSAEDTITANGQIDHVYTSAGNDSISVASTVNSLIYAGSGNDTINSSSTVAKIYAHNGNDEINITGGNATIYTGEGNDTVNVSNGTSEIYLTSGNDVINISGGTGGTIHFTTGGGDKTVNFNGASDAQYSLAMGDYSYRYYYKEGKNLRIETRYNHNYETGEYQTENYYLNNFFNPDDAKLDPNTTYINSSRIKYTDFIIIGEDDPSITGKRYEGTFLRDNITGTDGNDYIITGSEYDEINAGKGDDFILVNGKHEKLFYYSKGDGNDTISITPDVVFDDNYYEGYDGIRFYNVYGTQTPDNYSYSLDNGDLTIYRSYINGDSIITDSTKITGIRALDNENPAEITAENIANSDGGLNLSRKLYIESKGWFSVNMAQMNLGEANSANNISTNEGTNNAVIGGSKADIITSSGENDFIFTAEGDDIITTNANNSTIYSGEGNDTITVNSNTSTINAGEGDDTITVVSGTTTISTGNGNDIIKIQGGQGTINFELGKGNKTVIFEANNEDGTCDVAGVYNINIVGTNYGMGYSKSGNDLVVRVSHSEGTQTLKIKELFGANQLSDGNMLKISGSNLSEMSISGNYDPKLKATVYEGSNYNDYINGTTSTDVIMTGAGNDRIYADKGNDTIKITGTGTKTFYNYKGDGNETVQLTTNNLGELRFYNYGYPDATSYQIKNNNLILYRTYVNGDKFTNETTTITGIKGLTDPTTPVTYANITDSDGGLNISGKITSGMPAYLLTQGNASKANKITTKANTNNLILGGSKNDTISLNGQYEKVYTGAGADVITVNTTSEAYVYGGSGNDTITLNGSGDYRVYSTKGGGADTVKLANNFNGYLRVYADDSPNITSYQIDKSNNLILYRTYVSGDSIRNDSTKITGIKSKTADKVAVTYDNITSYSGGLNISGKLSGLSNYWMTQGNASKANTLTDKKDKNNVVTGGSKVDKVTLQGYNDYTFTGAGNDTVNVLATSSAYVYTGSGADTINIKNSGYNYVYSGKGNDKINVYTDSAKVYHYVTAGEGSDTIKFANTNFYSYRLSFSGYNSSYGTYAKSGNNLLVRNTYKTLAGKTVTETQTITDYFKNKEALENKIYIGGSSARSRLSDYGLTIVGAYNKKTKTTTFTGTEYKDTITGTTGKDVITTGNGNDTIKPGKGNDTITINGSGNKYITIGNEGGNDILRWSGSNATGTAYITYNKNDAFSSKRSGKDLVITRTYTPGGNGVKYETTTVKDYYLADGTVNDTVADKLYVNGTKYDPATSVSRVNYKTQKINVTKDNQFAVGTGKNDTVTIDSDNTVLFSLKGNDTIYLNGDNSFIVGGEGTDTIHLNTEGLATICHLSGDGNDRVIFDKAPSALTLSIESHAKSTTLEYMMLTGKLGFRKSGNNLNFYVPVNNTKTTKSEAIVLTDYFNNEVQKPEDIGVYLMLPDYTTTLSVSELLDEVGIWSVATTSGGVATFTGLDEYRNNYEYKGTGTAQMNGSSNTDLYFATIGAKSNLTISDKGGNSDTLGINASYTSLKAFFNVDSYGSVIVNDNQLSDNFMIFNKGSLTKANITNIFKGKNGTGVINIDNFFTGNGGEVYAEGNGYIEDIVAAKDIYTQLYNYNSGGYKNIQNIISEGWIGQVCEKVSGWLSTYSNGKYADKTAFDVIDSGNTTDINAMLNVYNGITYNKNYST